MDATKFVCGERVNIVLLELPGIVTAICIRDNNNITYEVIYFSNGEYNQNWFDHYEISKVTTKNKASEYRSALTEVLRMAKEIRHAEIDAPHSNAILKTIIKKIETYVERELL